MWHHNQFAGFMNEHFRDFISFYLGEQLNVGFVLSWVFIWLSCVVLFLTPSLNARVSIIFHIPRDILSVISPHCWFNVEEFRRDPHKCTTDCFIGCYPSWRMAIYILVAPILPNLIVTVMCRLHLLDYGKVGQIKFCSLRRIMDCQHITEV